MFISFKLTTTLRSSIYRALTTNINYRYSQYIIEQLIKEDRYFRCLQKNYRSNDDFALCKNSSYLTTNQVIAQLQIIEVKLAIINIDVVEEEENNSFIKFDLESRN